MDASDFLRRIRSKDPSLWDDLMPMVTSIVRGACRRHGIYDQRQMDITQDVAIKLYTHWESFTGTSSLTTWVHSIAANRCLDVLRSGRVRGEHLVGAGSDEDEAPDNCSGSSAGNSNEQRACLQQVFSALAATPPSRAGDRSAFEILEFWIEQAPSTEELAGFLGRTPAAAKEKKSQVWKQLKQLCLEFCGSADCSLST